MAAFDVIVIGLGAMGSAAVEHLARRGVDVLGIDRYGISHAMGSSHGRSRAIRKSYFEDPAYVPLVLRAYEHWMDLQRRAREPLITLTGTLEMGRSTGSTIIDGAIRSNREHNLMHEVWDRDEINRRFPVFDLPPSYIGVWQPDGGFVRPEAAVRANIGLAMEAGARVHIGERVARIEPKQDVIEVVTDEARYECGQVVVAAGPWLPRLVPELQGIARPTRQVTGWFWPRDPQAFSLDRFPVFIVDDGVMGAFYGFPAFEDGGVKVARHGHLNELMDPDGSRLPINDRDVVILRSFLARRVPLLDGEPVRTQSCIYTNMPDGHFLVDWLPSDSRILVVSPCSGHGFKFSPVIGEIVADLVTRGETPLPIEPFGFHRLASKMVRR